ncbi:MAG: phosphonate ABC transporter, permease protein PhnE [Candidatus Thermoplasmatota archaeon]|nr:phosphonate ABC transporter, permease protein PhnE [Candidatus Thermoplasmatota archaeon]MEC8257728.1 phosphonate ABC transporter, permease protein PhnE [Candidatus Thermoplasmatota archaeon]MEC8313142.1 phosphonate ABC transporter, permease protein PhnE [Candidatus Thermoplasmatota archaeon]
MNKKLLISIIVVLLLTLLAIDDVIGDWSDINGSFENLYIFFTEDLFPPDWSILSAEPNLQCNSEIGFFCSQAWKGISETIQMAFIATVIGFIISLPIASLAANNLYPLPVAMAARVVLAGLRSLPSIIWALIFTIAIGFGPLSGVLAMTLYTIGYLGKLQYEAIEGIANEPLEASMAMGLTKTERFMFVVIPESSNSLISQLLFMFEYNVRHGTVLGLVGAGGIGKYIDTNLKFFVYDKAMAFLIVIFVVVVIIDILSMIIRSYVTDESDFKRPKWWSVLLPGDAAMKIQRRSLDEK